MWQATLPLPRLPLSITCFADASVSFAPVTRFDVFIDQVDAELQVVVNEHEIKLGDTEVVLYNENIRYKDRPLVLKWLQSLAMETPTFR